MGRRAEAKKWYRRVDWVEIGTMVAVGLTVALLLYVLVWYVPLTATNRLACADLGGVYKNGTCFKVTGAYQLK